jgi:uncharacterized cupredoxin-like copper-binding protein
MNAEAGRSGLNRLIAVAILAVAVLTISGCSGSGQPKRTAGEQIRVAERDFKLSLAKKRVRAGDVTLAVTNKGPDSHELIVVKSKSARLPLRRDGMTVDEDALKLKHSIAGLFEPSEPGHHSLSLHLSPGRYELLCNMTGHYFGGMRTQLVVQ